MGLYLVLVLMTVDSSVGYKATTSSHELLLLLFPYQKVLFTGTVASPNTTGFPSSRLVDSQSRRVLLLTWTWARGKKLIHAITIFMRKLIKRCRFDTPVPISSPIPATLPAHPIGLFSLQKKNQRF